MATQIMNGGIYGGLLRIAKEDGAILSDEDEAKLAMLEALPKGVWIDLDDNGNPISKEEAKRLEQEKLSKFRVINQNKP